MTDKEFLDGETECPMFGKAVEENPHWCADCNIGTDGTAVCMFRKCEWRSRMANNERNALAELAEQLKVQLQVWDILL